MGNEMGNNNTSGLREEDNTNPEGQEKSLPESVHATDVKGENNMVVPMTESKDYHQKETGLDSDASNGEGDNPALNQTSDETAVAEQEIHPPVESPKVEKKLGEENGEESELQPEASLAEQSEDRKDQTSSNSEEKILEMSNNQNEEQSSFGIEEEAMLNSTSVAISSAQDPESKDSKEQTPDQHELPKVQAHHSGKDSINLPRGTENMAGSSVACNGKENGRLLDSFISDSPEENVVSLAIEDVTEKIVSQGDEMSGEHTFQVEIGVQLQNDSSETRKVSLDLLEVCSGGRVGKLNCNGTDSVESQLEKVSLPETKLTEKESESAVSRHDNNESVRGSEIDKESASQTDSIRNPSCENNEKEDNLITAHATASNGNSPLDDANILVQTDNQNEASENFCEGPEGKILTVHEPGMLAVNSLIADGESNEDVLNDRKPEAYSALDAATNGSCQVEEAKAVEQPDSKNEASEEHFNGPEGKIMMVPELRNFATESLVANGKTSKEEWRYCKPGPYTAHDRVHKENCQVEEVKVVKASDNQSEASKVAIMVVPELGVLPAELPFTNGKHNEEESEDFKAKQEEPTEKQIAEIKENIEAPGVSKRETDDTDCGDKFLSKSLPADARLPCDPASLFQAEDHQQETVTKSDNAQDSSDSTLDPKLESNSGFFAATASSFHATSSAVETLVSEAELAIEKPAEEGLPQVTDAATKMVTEINSSSSAYNSTEQHQKNDSSIFAKVEVQEQENAGGFSAGPSPEKKIQAEVPKSPSSTMDIAVSAVQLGIEKPQRGVLCYTTAVPETSAEANSSTSSVQFTEQREKVETHLFARGSYERQESVKRFSNESTPDYLNIRAEMRKSPSFDLDLRIEARSTEESDDTPLLYEDKNTIEGLSSQVDISLRISFSQAQHDQEELLNCQEMPVQEKVITLEKSDSEKSKTPFLGFLKEDEEAHVVIQNKQDKEAAAKKVINKEVSATPLKVKEKHKRRSSLFTNCMCCTTVIN